MFRQKPSTCVAGDEAIARGAWENARELFTAALNGEETPELLEGLGHAAWWLDLAPIVFDSRERAYRLYLAHGDKESAARIAVWLGWDYCAFRGENAVGNGWLQRARRLLENRPPSPESVWLEVREGALTLLEDRDPDRARAMAEEGIRIASSIRHTDLEMVARALLGKSLVASGSVAQGMRQLDEVNAAVISGEMKDLICVGISCCYMIAACERVRDYERALQWCARLKAFSAKWGMRPLFAICRTQYASMCVWRGLWDEAEEELEAATVELAASRPAMTPDALVRLAELRRRQGRLSDAAALLDRAHPLGTPSLGRAEIAFDRGDARLAAEQTARFLRGTRQQCRVERVAALELLVRSRTEAGDREGARESLDALTEIAGEIDEVTVRAASSYAKGYVALANLKLDPARQAFEDAVDLYLECRAPFEVARARIELGRTLGKMNRVSDAIEEVRRAIDSLTELKADLELRRATRVLDSLMSDHGSQLETGASEKNGGTARELTKREAEVLRLVAEGMNNQSIAKQLFVSNHTVHRHLANILNKLDVSTRAAAVAQAVRRGILS